MSLRYTKAMFMLSAAYLLSFVSFSFACPVFAEPVFKIGTSEVAKYADALAIECPQPEIPASLHEECYKSCCLARFSINHEGKHEVSIISSSGSDEVDEIALSTLRRWKFKPAMLNGKPVQSVRKIKVEFEVE
ncbi:MAG TPA: energy transducer TonB [Candidatus Melainabacteria bacterium]|nr:energy transducer TonB [Candidatus Melainabacteria bacterium]